MLGPQPGKMGKAERMYLELEMSERPSRLGRIASGFIGGGHSGIPDQNLLEWENHQQNTDIAWTVCLWNYLYATWDWGSL